MAKRPAVMPDWVTVQYGGYGLRADFGSCSMASTSMSDHHGKNS